MPQIDDPYRPATAVSEREAGASPGRCWVPRPVVGMLLAIAAVLVVLNALLYASPSLSEQLVLLVPDALLPIEQGCDPKK